MSETWDVMVRCAQCAGEPAGRLVLFRSGVDELWHLGLVGDASGNFTALTAELVDDRALPAFAPPDVATSLDAVGRRRERYRFECLSCGDNVPARHEKLANCAENLAGHAAPDVSMTALRRMLSLV